MCVRVYVCAAFVGSCISNRTASERPNLTYLTEGKHARLFGCLPYYKLTQSSHELL